MAGKKKKRSNKLELYVSWMLGCLLLLISNQTVFKSNGASIGDPWFNLFLSAVILAMLVKIGLSFVTEQKNTKLSASNIGALDRMDEEHMARYLGKAFGREGWTMEGLEAGPSGARLSMSMNGRHVQCLIRKSRRKLTQEAVNLAAAYRMESRPEMEVWLITNGSFTSSARREASARGVKLWQREDLVDYLAKLDASYTLTASG